MPRRSASLACRRLDRRKIAHLPRLFAYHNEITYTERQSQAKRRLDAPGRGADPRILGSRDVSRDTVCKRVALELHVVEAVSLLHEPEHRIEQRSEVTVFEHVQSGFTCSRCELASTVTTFVSEKAIVVVEGRRPGRHDDHSSGSWAKNAVDLPERVPIVRDVLEQVRAHNSMHALVRDRQSTDVRLKQVRGRHQLVRLAQAAANAARSEPLYWKTPTEGEPVLVDRYDRDLERVRHELDLASKIGRQLATIADLVETRLTSGREWGPQFPRRLLNNVETIARAVERDNRVVRALVAGWNVEAEKRAQLQADRGAAD